VDGLLIKDGGLPSLAGDIIPDTDQTRSIGSSSLRINEIYGRYLRHIEELSGRVGSTIAINPFLGENVVFNLGTYGAKTGRVVVYNRDLSAFMPFAITKDGILLIDTIDEYTTDAGVTIDGLLIKDGIIPTSGYPEALLRDGTRALTGDLDFAGNQAINLILEKLTADPTLAVGRVWFRTDLGRLKYSPDGLVAKLLTHDHGELEGLGDDDHTQYVHVSTARTITAQHTFNPSVVGAPFLLGANAQGQLVSGLNAEELDGLHATDLLTRTPDYDSGYFAVSLPNNGTASYRVAHGLGVKPRICIGYVTRGTGYVGNIGGCSYLWEEGTWWKGGSVRADATYVYFRLSAQSDYDGDFLSGYARALCWK